MDANPPRPPTDAQSSEDRRVEAELRLLPRRLGTVRLRWRAAGNSALRMTLRCDAGNQNLVMRAKVTRATQRDV